MKISIRDNANNQSQKELKFYLEFENDGQDLYLKAEDENRMQYIPLRITEKGFQRLNTNTPLPKTDGNKVILIGEE